MDINKNSPADLEQGAALEEEFVQSVDDKTVRKATEILNKYKKGKKRLEEKLISHEEFWKMRQWSSKVGDAKIGNGGDPSYKVHSTPWLHSCIDSRHADAMDSYPTCNFRPRQKDDEAEAKRLSSIVPVVLEQNDFEDTYSAVSRYLLNHGAGIFGVFWDPTKHNGIGDISIKKVDALSLYWEPGVSYLQDSANVFYLSLVDNDLLNQKYPQTEGKLGGKSTFTTKYLYDDSIDTDGKSVVVDWYYHRSFGGKRVLHYCQYVNDIVLFASENDPAYEEGYYNHGLYPFVMHPLYPIEGTPFGYGLIDIGQSTQLQIDILNKAIVDNAAEGSRPRYWRSESSVVNAEDFNDPTVRLVTVSGSVDETHLRPITTPDLPGIYVTYLNNKIEELKFCTANQDVNNGVAPSGVTAASGLAALQETGGKRARNTNRSLHRAFKDVVYQIVELIRQFYNTPRQFRIAPDANGEEFITYTNTALVPQPQSIAGSDVGLRKPEFDIEVTVEKANPYKKMEHNELMIQLHNLGVFNPQNTDQSLALVNHMDFDGKEEVVETVEKNATIMEKLLQYQQIALQLAQATDPALAEQLSQIITADIGGAMKLQGLPMTSLPSSDKEHPFVEKSRSSARASTQVD